MRGAKPLVGTVWNRAPRHRKKCVHSPASASDRPPPTTTRQPPVRSKPERVRRLDALPVTCPAGCARRPDHERLEQETRDSVEGQRSRQVGLAERTPAYGQTSHRGRAAQPHGAGRTRPRCGTFAGAGIPPFLRGSCNPLRKGGIPAPAGPSPSTPKARAFGRVAGPGAGSFCSGLHDPRKKGPAPGPAVHGHESTGRRTFHAGAYRPLLRERRGRFPGAQSSSAAGLNSAISFSWMGRGTGS